MDDTPKYLIHADITANGVVERTDVVGAVFGQTEGLLGDELDIRALQESSRLGRIDVEVESEGGRSFGRLVIASNLDKVETAILAAALETIERVGPCRSHVRVTDIEDAREAKRHAIVDRATELLAEEFDDGVLTSEAIIDAVREEARVADIAEYEGLPAGPNVADSDAVIVVEGRADVLTLLQYGIKSAVGVEGTDVPQTVAELTAERTVTAFLDGDRGGDLILRELAQVADVDYVARAPRGESVEDLSRSAVMDALREKVPLDAALDRIGGEAEAATTADGGAVAESSTDTGPAAGSSADAAAISDGEAAAGETDREAATLEDHAAAVLEESGAARLLDADFAVLATVPAAEASDALREADPVPHALVLDGAVDQRTLDVAARRGVAVVVARERGAVVKQPAGVRLLTAATFRS